jgi:hypothetical protein
MRAYQYIGPPAVLLLLACVDAWSQPRPVDPVRAILAAFDRVNLVGLGERHGVVEDSHFRLRLIRDPEFARKVNDIVIEFGNPLYQGVLDRYVDGEDVPRAELSQVWQKTTQQGGGRDGGVVWNSPVYEELITAVRAVNAGLPGGKRMRVVAGDYPIDFAGEPRPYNRDEAAAAVIRSQVLDKNRKALLIFGAFHVMRQNGSQLKLQPIMQWLQGDARATSFMIVPISGLDWPAMITAHAAAADRPALIMTTGAAGDLDTATMGWDVRQGQRKVRELTDAILYFGKAAPRVARPVAAN